MWWCANHPNKANEATHKTADAVVRSTIEWKRGSTKISVADLTTPSEVLGAEKVSWEEAGLNDCRRERPQSSECIGAN
jgi:hypothetical protein